MSWTHVPGEPAIHVDVVGEGPPVLMLQGAGAVGEAWRPQAEALKHQYTCCLVDNRGIGGSGPAPGRLSVAQMAEDVRRVMDHLGWEQAHVVGHSIGGLIAQQLAVETPERVRSLCLMCTFHTGRVITAPRAFMMWVGMRMQIGPRAWRRRAFLELVLTPEELANEDLDAVAESMRPAFGRDLADTPSIVMRQTLAGGRHDLLDRLGELAELPTLVVSGLQDRVAEPRHGQALAEAIPGARFLGLPGAHGFPLRDPEPVNAALLAHLAEVEARRSGRR